MWHETAGFGSVLQQYRVAASISQEELAERAGLSRRGISDLERGARQTPHLATVRRLAQALGLDLDGQAALLAAARQQPLPSTPLRPLRRSPLPLSLTTFVGREEPLAEVCNLVAKTRLVTLTGPGGIGKTRLALECARNIEQQDVALAFVELAALRDPGLVPQAVASSLGLREQRERDVVDTLIDALASRHSVLVLDNCEHLLSACAALAEQLLRACPELRILATSREGLGVAGERIWRVPSLELPDPEHLPPLDELARYAAVRLFLDRAASVDGQCVLTELNASEVAEICHKLDGIPLAIELAAARANVLNVHQIARRLDDRLRLLTSSSRSTPERQRTLRATLEWSYDLLAEDEKRLFERLAVFAGGWTLEGCEVVCSGEGVTRDDVLDLLGRLVDKSLVAVSDDHATRRYRLLETVREYAQERLEGSGEGDALRAAHAAVYVVLAEAAAPQLQGALELEWLHRLDVEYDNFRAAVAYSLAHADIVSVLRLGPALAYFGWVRGRFREQRRWAEICLEHCGTDHPLRSLAAGYVGIAAYTQGDYAEAFPLLDEALARARAEGNKPLLAFTLKQLGFASPLRGDPRAAIELFTEAEALFRELGQPHQAANALVGLGQTARLFGEYDRAEEYFQRSLEDGRVTGNPTTISHSLQCLGSVAVLRGELARGNAYLCEAVPILVALENGIFLGYCALHLAQIALAQENGRRAARLLGAADGMWRSDNTAIYPTYREMWRNACDAAAAVLGEKVFASIFASGQGLSLEDVAAFALTTGAPPGVDTQAPEAVPDGLTTREREIVSLLAAGLSNREIADRLVISESTTEVHVKHILSKLGFKSRTQVAAWFSRRESMLESAARGTPA
jgi:predicted ATPase/DNA-binding CsgD family transcriptional regulator/DNA-binding XRE family transcriptional regulator